MLLSGEHLLLGALPTNEQRITDILNDHRTDYIRGRSVRVFRRRDNRCVATLPEIALPKAKLDMVLILDEEHEAKRKRMNCFVDKQADPVFLTVRGAEIRGQLHLSGPRDPVWFLTQQGTRFFPITQASVSQVLCGGEPLQASVAIVNKEAVLLFCLDPGDEARPHAAAPE